MRMQTPIPNRKQPTLSFEFYPPKSEEGWTDLRTTLSRTKELALDFVSVTYGAGGSTRAKTVELCAEIQQDLGLSAMAHLTCVGHSRAEIDGILDQLEASRVSTVLALRGDPPKGTTEFVAHADGHANATGLIDQIARRGGFSIGCAFYPEVHPEAESPAKDLEFLKAKQDLGSSFAVSQLFYDVDGYLRFRDAARAQGITIPLVAGIMPITSIIAARRFVKVLPAEVESAIAAAGDDAAAIAEAGVAQAVAMIERLLSEGIEGVHLYTLNKSLSSPRVVEALRARGHFLR